MAKAEFQEIEVALIDDPEIATRVEIDEQHLDELAADIKRNGLFYPLIVMPKGDRYEVVDGHRRLLACRRLGLIRVMCKLHGADAPPLEEVKLKTNLLRVQNNDAELAVFIGELVDKHGYNIEQLQAATGMKEGWINDRYALLKGDGDVLVALGEGKINFSQAKVLNRCPDKGWRDLGLHYAIADNLPAEKLRDWLVRNTSVPRGEAPPVTAVESGSGEVQPVASGIVCEWCGGFKDPQNMVNIWLHRWEWDTVQRMLKLAHEQGGSNGD